MEEGEVVAPRVQRAESPRQQVVGYYRQRIMDGELADGDRLPPIREIVKEWGVSSATVVKAVGQLQAEGLIRTTPGGTYVTAFQEVTYTPRDRIFATQRTGKIYPPSERAKVLAAEVVPAPPAVAEALGIEPGVSVVRRERVTYHAEVPVTWSVSWMPGDLADLVPELVSTDRIPGGTVGRVAAVTGRKVTGGRDQLWARPAEASEAEVLGIEPGDAVLAGTNSWADDDDIVIEWGEFIIPTRRRIAYDYTMTE
jgi:DNA-binding GntR family transcriptional regulator